MGQPKTMTVGELRAMLADAVRSRQLSDKDEVRISSLGGRMLAAGAEIGGPDDDTNWLVIYPARS